MMLTMCPSWALADDEDIALLPANEEIAVPVVDSTPAADTTETPAVPTPSEPEAKPAEDQNTAPAPSDNEANGGTDSTEAGNSTNPTIPEVSENNSQNNNAASNSPENEISMASLDVDAYSLNGVKTIEAEYWITNLHAKDDNGSWKLSIDKDTVGEDGKSVAELAPSERHVTADETYNTVFWQARVQHGLLQHQTTLSNDDKTQSGTEITSIRYKNDRLEYCAKDSSEWTAFAWNDHLVFYYLIRTEYSQMVQIDVSDWTVDKEQTQHLNRRSVTYQVIVEENGTQTVADSKKFWYNKAFTVSSVRVRQTESENYSINRVELDPSTMGTVGEVDGEYRFSLDLTKAKRDEATVKIYVEPKVQSHQLTYKLNGGKITSAEGTYTPAGSVYPDATVNTPEVAKDNCDFGGWYIDEALTQKWTGTTMPDANLTLYAKFTAKETPNPNPEPENQKAMYFVLLPNRGVPKSGASQGTANYLPNETSDGGVKGVTRKTGYEGYLTEDGKEAADKGEFSANGVDSSYLILPSDLGFFTAANWNGTTYPADKTNTSAADITALLGTNYNPQIAEVVWYTVKHDDTDGYHVDGYVKNVDVNVTYHSNYGDDVTDVYTATTGNEYAALSYEATGLLARENYTFGGWYTDKDCTEAYETTTLMTSLDLYAKWVPNQFDVSYFVDNEKYGETEKHDVDSTVTVKAAPTKEGYTFTGWTNIVTVDTTTGQFTMPAQDVRFDATFEINQYNVTYKVGTEVVYTDVYNFDADVAIRPVPTQEGYTFYGWTSKDSAFDIRGFKMPAHDVVIEGKFEKNPAKQYTYTVNKHFYDEKGVEVNVEKGEAKTAVENTAVSELYKKDAVNQTVDGKTYVYVPGLTTVTDKLETLTKDVTIDLYYYLNNRPRC